MQELEEMTAYYTKDQKKEMEDKGLNIEQEIYKCVVEQFPGHFIHLTIKEETDADSVS